MRMWIKNISDNKQYVECYHKGGPITPCTIEPKEVVEVNTTYYVDSFPMNFKYVDKPNPRYLTNWAVGIGCAILGSLITIVIGLLI